MLSKWRSKGKQLTIDRLTLCYKFANILTKIIEIVRYCCGFGPVKSYRLRWCHWFWPTLYTSCITFRCNSFSLWPPRRHHLIPLRAYHKYTNTRHHLIQVIVGNRRRHAASRRPRERQVPGAVPCVRACRTKWAMARHTHTSNYSDATKIRTFELASVVLPTFEVF